MLNRVQLIGSLGADPELRETASGTLVGNLRIATTERVKKGDQWEDHTEWHRVVCFGKGAENAGKYLIKGSRVFIEGRLRTTKYADKSGVDRWSTDVIADEIKFLSTRSKDSSRTGVEDTQIKLEDDIPF